MAIFLVNHDMSVQQFERLGPDHNLTLPASVIEMFEGALGEPEGGWPKQLAESDSARREAAAGPAGRAFDAGRISKRRRPTLGRKIGHDPAPDEVLSFLMYPDVFLKFAAGAAGVWATWRCCRRRSSIYGMKTGDEIAVELEPGKTLVVKFLTVGEPHPDGYRTVFFELNGQPREVKVRDKSLEVKVAAAAEGRSRAARSRSARPFQGWLSTVAVESNQVVKKGDRLLVMEAMKMQSTVYAPVGGKVTQVLVQPGRHVEAKDLLLVVE